MMVLSVKLGFGYNRIPDEQWFQRRGIYFFLLMSLEEGSPGLGQRPYPLGLQAPASSPVCHPSRVALALMAQGNA